MQYAYKDWHSISALSIKLSLFHARMRAYFVASLHYMLDSIACFVAFCYCGQRFRNLGSTITERISHGKKMFFHR